MYRDIENINMLEKHLEKIVTLVGIVEAGSIRRYALQQRLSQPGVSQSVASLERVLGVALLNRSRHGVTLTEAGRVVYSLGCSLVVETQGAESALSAKGGDRKIRLGTYDSVAIYLIPTVLQVLRRRAPDVSVILTCDRSAQVLRQVEEGRLDGALCVTPQVPRGCESVEIYEDRYDFFAGADPFVPNTLVTLLDAEDNRGLSISSHLKRTSLSGYHLIGAPSFEVAAAMIRSGLGVGVLPRRVAEADSKRGWFKKWSGRGVPSGGFGPHSFRFVRRKVRQKDPVLDLLLELIRQSL